MIEPSSPQKMGDEFKIGKSLFEEAKKRGFKKGVVATHLTDYSKKKTITSNDYQYYPNNDSLYMGLAGETIKIYHNDKWSKVVDKWWMAVEVGDYLECKNGLINNEINGAGYESRLKFKVTSIEVYDERYCFFGGKEDNGVYYSAIKNPYLKENEKNNIIDILPYT